VTVAKNYLIEKENKSLERIVSMYLDYAELQACRRVPMKMQDWVQKLDAFLKFNEYEVLTDAGGVSHEVAGNLAGEEYEKFRVTQDREYIGDSEKEVKISLQNRGGVKINSPAARPLRDVQHIPEPVFYLDVSIDRLMTL